MLNLEFIYFLMPISQRGIPGDQKGLFLLLTTTSHVTQLFPFFPPLLYPFYWNCFPLHILFLLTQLSHIEFITGQFASPESIIPLLPPFLSSFSYFPFAFLDFLPLLPLIPLPFLFSLSSFPSPSDFS